MRYIYKSPHSPKWKSKILLKENDKDVEVELNRTHTRSSKVQTKTKEGPFHCPQNHTFLQQNANMILLFSYPKTPNLVKH